MGPHWPAAIVTRAVNGDIRYCVLPLDTQSFRRTRWHTVAAAVSSRFPSENRARRPHPRGNVAALEPYSEKASAESRKRRYQQRSQRRSPWSRIEAVTDPERGR